MCHPIRTVDLVYPVPEAGGEVGVLTEDTTAERHEGHYWLEVDYLWIKDSYTILEVVKFL